MSHAFINDSLPLASISLFFYWESGQDFSIQNVATYMFASIHFPQSTLKNNYSLRKDGIYLFILLGNISDFADVIMFNFPFPSFIHWIYVSGAYFDFISSYIILVQVRPHRVPARA